MPLQKTCKNPVRGLAAAEGLEQGNRRKPVTWKPWPTAGYLPLHYQWGNNDIPSPHRRVRAQLASQAKPAPQLTIVGES